MVLVCDCQYRSAICVIRTLAELGEDVIAVTTDRHPNPPSFSSRYIKEKIVLPSDENKYKSELLNVCTRYNKPVIFPCGNQTLNVLSKGVNEFSEVAYFCVSDYSLLSKLNDKKFVKKEAKRCGISVPEKLSVDNIQSYPVVTKPYCGEKFALKAADRYVIAKNYDELIGAYNAFKEYDPDPIIEEYIDGIGVGVSVVCDKNSKVKCVFCHERIVQFPTEGGPSACLKTFYNKELIDSTVKFFESLGFIGIAMAEYKKHGDKFYLLEINPRIWGSFPATLPTKSDFVFSYLLSSKNKTSQYSERYKRNKSVKFLRGLIASFISCFKTRKYLTALKILGTIINPFVSFAVLSFKDPIPTIRDFFRR